VPSWGDDGARLVVVGAGAGPDRAPTARPPFTGDHAGVLLYETLLKTGFARGRYEARPGRSLELVDCLITNAVRCAPPGNKPETSRRRPAARYLAARLAACPNLKVIVTLGDVSRRNVLRALGMKASAGAAGHGSETRRAPTPDQQLPLLPAQHEHRAGSRPRCSRRCSCAPASSSMVEEE
jgi:uracil-DNA glycosylase family 4